MHGEEVRGKVITHYVRLLHVGSPPKWKRFVALKMKNFSGQGNEVSARVARTRAQSRSTFTLCTIAKWFLRNFSITFFCGNASRANKVCQQVFGVMPMGS